MTDLVSFDYAGFTQEEIMELRIISERLKVRVQRTAEEMIAMGEDLHEAKRVVKEDGKKFTRWCESEECPVGYYTAQRLMSVQHQLGHKKSDVALFSQGYNVLATVTQTTDEEIRAALLEHVEQETEKGEKVTQKEISALKKALAEERKRAEELGDKAFSADKVLNKIKTERDQIREKKEQFARDLIEADKRRKELEQEIERTGRETDRMVEELEAEHRDEMAALRERIIEEEKNKPRTDAEVEAREARLAELKVEMAKARTAAEEDLAQLKQERKDIAAQLKEEQAREIVTRRTLDRFSRSAVAYMDACLSFSPALEALPEVTMTDNLYTQLETLEKATENALEAIRNARAIQS